LGIPVGKRKENFDDLYGVALVKILRIDIKKRAGAKK
jgi:hypothetical protein